MRQRNPYDVLGVDKGASEAEIRSAYLKRVKVLHPDRFDKEKQSVEWQMANDMFQELNVAYNQLGVGREDCEVPGGFKNPSEPEENVPHEILNPKVGTLYSVFSRYYPRNNGTLARTTIEPQEVYVHKTSSGSFAFKYAEGTLFKSSHVVMLVRDTKEIGRLPDAFAKATWKSFIAKKGAGGFDLLSHGIFYLANLALAKADGIKGIYLHFTNEEGNLRQVVLLGNANLIDAVMKIAPSDPLGNVIQEQIDRRSKFLAGINAGLAEGKIKNLQKDNPYVVASIVQNWNVTDWKDLPDVIRNQITIWVEQFRENEESFEINRKQVEGNISSFSLLILAEIKRALVENGMTPR